MANVSMPALNVSAIAAFGPGGAPLPAFAYGGDIYVVQNGAPAEVVYVPAYANSSGIYKVELSLGEPAVVVIPPGVMPQDMPSYRLLSVNNTGVYVQVGPGRVALSYYAASMRTAAQSAQQPVAPSSTSASSPATTSAAAAGVPQSAVYAAVIIIAIAAAALLALRGRRK